MKNQINLFGIIVVIIDIITDVIEQNIIKVNLCIIFYLIDYLSCSNQLYLYNITAMATIEYINHHIIQSYYCQYNSSFPLNFMNNSVYDALPFMTMG
jgi:hypothetical protein